jgi:hypothetical protein
VAAVPAKASFSLLTGTCCCAAGEVGVEDEPGLDP